MSGPFADDVREASVQTLIHLYNGEAGPNAKHVFVDDVGGDTPFQVRIQEGHEASRVLRRTNSAEAAIARARELVAEAGGEWYEPGAAA